MISKPSKYRQKSEPLDQEQVVRMPPTLRIWVLILVVMVGLLTQLGFPAWFMMHTLIDGDYLGQMELTIEPEGSIHLKMDNRQDSLTDSEKPQVKQPKASNP